MNQKKNKISPFFKRFFYSFLHGLALIIICWWWLSIDYTLDLEKTLAEKSTLLKRTLTKDTADYFEDFVFLDVSGIKKLVPKQDQPGNNVITDRQKIAEFLNILNKVSKNDYQYIVYDLLSEDPSPDDKNLALALEQTSKIVAAYTLDDKGINRSIFIDVPGGYVGYKSSSGYLSTKALIKYKLISSESQESLPAVLYEKIHGRKVEAFAGLTTIGDQLSLNNMIIDMRIRSSSLKDKEGNNKINNFSQLLDLLKIDGHGFFNKFLKGKIIVIGDFEKDMHETVFGSTAGPLILSNVYLSLRDGDTIITFKSVFFILAAFTIISWMLLYPFKWIDDIHKWCERVPVGLILGEFIFYALLTWGVSFLCYLWFNFQLNVTGLSLYLSLFSTTRFYIEEYNKRKT